jgi:hypothetical protein
MQHAWFECCTPRLNAPGPVPPIGAARRTRPRRAPAARGAFKPGGSKRAGLYPAVARDLGGGWARGAAPPPPGALAYLREMSSQPCFSRAMAGGGVRLPLAGGGLRVFAAWVVWGVWSDPVAGVRVRRRPGVAFVGRCSRLSSGGVLG